MASETTANATVLSTDFSDWQKKKTQTDEIKITLRQISHLDGESIDGMWIPLTKDQ